MRTLSILFLVLFSMIFHSCTVEKRLYTKGYHVSKKQHLVVDKAQNTPNKVEHNNVSIVPATTSTVSLEKSYSPFTLNKLLVQGDCDVIYFKDGSQVDVRITMISDSEIQYKKCTTNDEILFSTSMENVLMVEYMNGDKFIPKKEYGVKDKDEKNVVVKTYTNNSLTYDGSKKDHPLAIASLILGAIGLAFAIIGLLFGYLTTFAGAFLFLYLGLLLAVAGMVMGIISLIQIKKKQERYTGKTLSILGIVFSGIVILIGFILFIGGLVAYFTEI